MTSADDFRRRATTPDPSPPPHSVPALRRESHPGTDDAGYQCDMCGAPMRAWMCRIICPNCGYQRDCEDP